ncbi:MAG: hypothetical protein V1698_00725 [bacterium]
MKNKKQIKIVFFSFLVVLTALFFSVFSFCAKSASAEEKEKASALFFYGTGCPACENVKPFLEDFQEKNADSIDIKSFDLYSGDKQVLDLFKIYATRYFLQSESVPTLFISDKVFQGADNIKNGLQKALVSCNNPCRLKVSLIEAVEDLQKKQEEEDFLKKSSEESASDLVIIENFNLFQVVNSALADSVSLFILAAIIILLAILFRTNFDFKEKDKKALLKIGAEFILGFFLVFFLVSLGIFQSLYKFSWPKYISIIFAILILIFAIFETRLILTGKNLKNNQWVKKAATWAVPVAGILAGLYQVSNFSAQYEKILEGTAGYGIGIISAFLFVYTLVLLLPLVIVLIIFTFGFDLERHPKLEKTFRIIMEAALVGLAAVLIL